MTAELLERPARHRLSGRRFFLNFQLLAAANLIAAPPVPAQERRLGATTFVALVEGLAAGMTGFALHEEGQRHSFPSQMAKQIGTNFPQPLMQAPGIGNAPGYESAPVLVPGPLQTVVRQASPPLFVLNLSVPGLRLSDAASRRPAPPLIHPDSALQTSINMILEFPSLLLRIDGRDVPLWSRLEYARRMFPTFALVEILTLLNRIYDTSFPLVDAAALLATDPATNARMGAEITAGR